MPTRIRFRLNKLTGEVEEFLVDDQDRTLPEAEHERIAAEVGRVIARNPALEEVLGPPTPAAPEPAEDEPGARDRERAPDERATLQGGGDDP
jgi:hypothetical protein